MAIVRKRTRKTADGTEKVRWLVDYRDQTGTRRFETFKLKKLADARLAAIGKERPRTCNCESYVKIEERLAALEKALDKPKQAQPRPRKKRSGRHAKVMPIYLQHRDISVDLLQAELIKTNGGTYSRTTLDRVLRACQDITGWLESQGVNLYSIGLLA
jgi:hypothetical protein